MAPHEFVEIRLVCKADYLDPQLKIKLHEIKDKLREILHTGRRRFALKKVQPWNSVKVTFDIPKEAADRLRLLAVQGNVRLVELGILSVEIVGQSSAISVNSNNAAGTTATLHPTTNSKDLPVASSLAPKTSLDALPSTTESIPASSTANFSFENKPDEHHRHKRVKLESDVDSHAFGSLTHFPYKDRSSSSTTGNLMQPPAPSSTTTMGHPGGHYLPQTPTQLVHRPTTPSHPSTANYGRLSHPNSIASTHPAYLNSGKPPPSPSPSGSYSVPTNHDNTNGLTNDMHNYHHHPYPSDTWSAFPDQSNNYKMKVNGTRVNHYYPPQQQPLILSENPSSSSPMYCAPAPNQYEMRRCESNMPPMSTSTTNLPAAYDGSSTGLSS